MNASEYSQQMLQTQPSLLEAGGRPELTASVSTGTSSSSQSRSSPARFPSSNQHSQTAEDSWNSTTLPDDEREMQPNATNKSIHEVKIIRHHQTSPTHADFNNSLLPLINPEHESLVTNEQPSGEHPAASRCHSLETTIPLSTMTIDNMAADNQFDLQCLKLNSDSLLLTQPNSHLLTDRAKEKFSSSRYSKISSSSFSESNNENYYGFRDQQQPIDEQSVEEVYKQSLLFEQSCSSKNNKMTAYPSLELLDTMSDGTRAGTKVHNGEILCQRHFEDKRTNNYFDVQVSSFKPRKVSVAEESLRSQNEKDILDSQMNSEESKHEVTEHFNSFAASSAGLRPNVCFDTVPIAAEEAISVIDSVSGSSISLQTATDHAHGSTKITNVCTKSHDSVARLPDGTELSTLFDDDDDDKILREMKYRAYRGFSEGRNSVDTIEPIPLENESEREFCRRSHDYWQSMATQSIGDQGNFPVELVGSESGFTRQLEQDNGEQEATVVAITDEFVHPADLSVGAVRAEFIGQDYDRTVHLPQVASAESIEPHATTAYASSDDLDNQDDSAEATVIDSAPLFINNVDLSSAWKYTEEVQVLSHPETRSQEQIFEDAKLPAIGNQGEVAEIAVADQEAEVLGIQEDVHPSEFEANDAEAELVGTDYTVAIGIAMPPGTTQRTEHGQPPTVSEITMISGQECYLGTEAQATLVHRDPQLSSLHTYIQSPSENINGTVLTQFNCTNEYVIADPCITSCDAIRTSSAVTLPAISTSEAPSNAKSFISPVDEVLTPGWLRDSNSISMPLEVAHLTPPARQPFGTGCCETSSERSTSSAGASFSQVNITVQNLSNNIARGTSNVIESLFGDTKPPFLRAKSRASAHDATESIRPRTLLPWSVIFSPTTKVWVATLQTNQKALDSNNVAEASKSLRAFSLPTERQAVCLAKAWTPPRMYSFLQNPRCHICRVRFAIFNRACHCRNCGVCVCRDCSIQWPAKMIPETYNRKRENNVNVCKGCDWLCHAFRLALLEGNFDKAVALHATANINANSPFANVKGELFYPVHCAVLGGNLNLLKWLVDVNCCPIKSVRVSGITRDSAGKYTPIVTSKGRSPLGIALENANISIVRYLVVDKCIRLSGEKDMTSAMLIRTLEAVLRILPEDCLQPVTLGERSLGNGSASAVEDVEDTAFFTTHQNSFGDPNTVRSLTDEARDYGAVNHVSVNNIDHRDECIICCDNNIDCVSNPCGHQVMCLRCAENVSRCPVCNRDCTFIRVYRP